MAALSPELLYTSLTAGFTGVFWAPIAVNRIAEIGLWKTLDNPERDLRAKANWAYRLANAHRNAVENLAVFAPLAIIVQVLGLNSPLTALAAIAFFAARVTHAVVYILGIPVLRTLAFAVGFLCQLALFLTILGLA